MSLWDAATFAERLYELYETLAPNFECAESAVPWDQVPEKNRNLMIAVADVILDELAETR